MSEYKIFKYAINLNMRTQPVMMPKGARVLSVQMQHDECQAWALVDTDAPRAAKRIEVLPTGAIVHEADKLSFLGTVQVDGGSLIFHVFERIES
jgi:hypothetical protein